MVKLPTGIRAFILLFLCIQFSFAQTEPADRQPTGNLLKLLQIIPSARSVEFVQHQTQFQLHSLPTEQRHSKTSNLSQRLQTDIAAGLKMLLSVDEDITVKLNELAGDRKYLEPAVQAVSEAIKSGKKIFIFGSGTSGRLAKQLESTFWRPFWQRLQRNRRLWKKLKQELKIPAMEQLVGVQAGGDRALITSPEGLEDLAILGELQLQEHGYRPGDVVFGVSCDGASSSVIGAMLAALNGWKKTDSYRPTQTRQKLLFVTSNPLSALGLFNRFRPVLQEPGITKIDLSTGPQAIAGSTRMQAATITQFVLGNIIQSALDRALRSMLSNRDMARIGFTEVNDLGADLNSFADILSKVKKSIPSLAKLAALEAGTYRAGHFATCFAGTGFMTTLVDCAERSRAYSLSPLDTVKHKARQSWIQAWSPAEDAEKAWQLLLGRPFRGLAHDFYYTPIKENILDRKQETAALESLAVADEGQKLLYDFSFSARNLMYRGPKNGDLGILIALTPEEQLIKKKRSPWQRFIKLHSEQNIATAFIFISERSEKDLTKMIRKISPDAKTRTISVRVPVSDENDPLGINRQTALKLVLNTQSTAVMAQMGRIIGNTMTHISPDNLKLIGRATHLIRSHVNSVLQNPQWVKANGIHAAVSYGEANAVLLSAAENLKMPQDTAESYSEVAAAIIRILESLRLKKGITWEDTFKILKEKGLSLYLADVTN